MCVEQRTQTLPSVTQQAAVSQTLCWQNVDMSVLIGFRDHPATSQPNPPAPERPGLPRTWGWWGRGGPWTHLEVREVLRHKIVDLADWKAPRFTVLKGHEDEDAEGREGSESLNF